ncbi:MAG TPA: hypothetical protein VN611_14060 [Patescibacteria group bacterium]|nr:hypothetical protein [Patescibacteria group bacterium]
MQKKMNILWDMQQIRQQRAQLIASKKNLDSAEIKRIWHQINLLKQSVAADEESLLCLEKVCDRQETDLAEVRAVYEDNSIKLNSGDLMDAGKMELLRQKCECIINDIGQREAEKAGSLDQCEKLMVNIIKQKQMIADRKQEHARKQHQLVQALNIIDEKVYALDEKYKSLLSRLDAAIVEQYREMEKRLTTPVAMVNNGVCGACQKPMPQGGNVDVLGIERCPECGRMIFSECGPSTVSL